MKRGRSSYIQKADGTRWHIYHVPNETAACHFLRFELKDNDIELNMLDPDTLVPIRRFGKQEKKPRMTEVDIQFGQEVFVSEIHIPIGAGRLRFFGREKSSIFVRSHFMTPDEAEMMTYYERKAKRKIINCFHFLGEEPPASVHWALARFRQFWGCDTNTVRYIGIGAVSATAVIRGQAGPISAEHSNGMHTPKIKIAVAGELNRAINAVMQAFLG